MRICPMCAELCVDGQTDVTKLIVAFSNFANELKMHFLPTSVSLHSTLPHCGQLHVSNR